MNEIIVGYMYNDLQHRCIKKDEKEYMYEGGKQTM